MDTQKKSFVLRDRDYIVTSRKTQNEILSVLIKLITTKIKLALGLVIFIYSSLLFSAENNNEAIRLETVRLQLKWFHAFQFAGYYAAKEQGFYIDEGLDVHILERNPELNIVNQVVSNEVQYGVEDTRIIVRYANGAPIIALAAIFQLILWFLSANNLQA